MNPSDFSRSDMLLRRSDSSSPQQAGIFHDVSAAFRRTAVITAALICIFSSAALSLKAADSVLADDEASVTFQLGTDPTACLKTPVSLSLHTKFSVCGQIDAFMHLSTAEHFSKPLQSGAPETNTSSGIMHRELVTLLQLFEAGFTHSVSFGGIQGTDKEVLTEIGLTAGQEKLMPYQKLSCRYTRESAPFSLIADSSCRWIYPLCFTFTEQITVLEVINRHMGISVTAAAGLTNEASWTEGFSGLSSAAPAEPLSAASAADAAAGSRAGRPSPAEQFTSFSSSFDLSSQISIIQEKTRHHIGFSLSFVQTGVLPRIQYSCSIIL